MDISKDLIKEIDDLKKELRKAEEALENSPEILEPKKAGKNKNKKK